MENGKGWSPIDTDAIVCSQLPATLCCCFTQLYPNLSPPTSICPQATHPPPPSSTFSAWRWCWHVCSQTVKMCEDYGPVNTVSSFICGLWVHQQLVLAQLRFCFIPTDERLFSCLLYYELELGQFCDCKPITNLWSSRDNEQSSNGTLWQPHKQTIIKLS